MASWPLPKRPRLDLTISVQDARLRSAVDHGPPKMRRRFTAAIRTWSFTILVTGTEKDALEYFYTTTLSEGVTAFDWTDESGAAESFRFARPPTFSVVTGHDNPDLRLWEVGVLLEALP